MKNSKKKRGKEGKQSYEKATEHLGNVKGQAAPQGYASLHTTHRHTGRR